MKEKRNLIAGLILGGVIGWTLGFLRLPYVEKNVSFWMGFVLCLALVFLGAVLMFVWNKNKTLLDLIDQRTDNNSGAATRTYRLLWMTVATFILLGGGVSTWLIMKQNRFFEVQALQQQEKTAEQAAMMASTRKSNLLVLMNVLFDKIDEELKNNPQRTLSEETIARIIALNHSFQPYRYLEGDSLSERKLSPERGQLLLLLSTFDIDTSSFNKIKSQTSFYGADLENANLAGANLSGIDLREANLNDANLSGAHLDRADLGKASLLRCNLSQSDLNQTNLEAADLRWANLSDANLRGADLDIVEMTAATLTRADLRNAIITYAELSGVFLNEADLTGSNLNGTNLENANLSGALVKDVNLRVANLTEAILEKTSLEGADLHGVMVADDSWLEKLDQWQVTGAEAIRKGYYIQLDKSGIYIPNNKIRVLSF